ncbi:MAG: NAD(P)/FAD-dependent oxidoreductase [Sulfolobaceae archaeon]|nr:NAD(P)/FAD-dependent oxidoreductase [Sulfolobaceae archaeon]
MKITVIGGGTAGFYSALISAFLGNKVTLIEKEDKLGGVCVNYGCIPSKAMYHLLHSITVLQSYRKIVNTSLEELQQFAKEASNKVSKGMEYTLEDNGVEIIHAKGSYRSGKILANNESINTDKVIIATGTSSNKPTPGYEDLPFLTSDFNSAIVIGATFGGIELAWLLKSMKKEVTVVEKMDKILPSPDIDDEIRNAVYNYLRRLGIKLVLSAQAQKIEKDKVVLVNGETLKADIVFSAFGRYPAIEGFEELPHSKGLIVNEYLETPISNIFGAGDIIGTHTATEAVYGGTIASLNAFGLRKRFNTQAMPYVIYTKPEIAYAGRIEGNCVKTNVASLSRGAADKEFEGFLKLCEKDGYLVGAQAFMEDAEDVIANISVLIRLKVKLDDILDIVYPHPSYLESILEAVRSLSLKRKT